MICDSSFGRNSEHLLPPAKQTKRSPTEPTYNLRKRYSVKMMHGRLLPRMRVFSREICRMENSLPPELLTNVFQSLCLITLSGRKIIKLSSAVYILYCSFIHLHRSYCTTLEVSSTANRIDPSSEKAHCLTKCAL